jgi:PAS domain S-box-containing protein
MLNQLSIGTKLAVAFAALAAVTILVVLSGLFAGHGVSRDIALAEAARMPASLTSARAQASLLNMQLHVRGYLVLGNRYDVEQYQLHKAAFESDLAALQRLAGSWAENDAHQVDKLSRDYAQWSSLPQKLFMLHDNPLNNRPALRLARMNVQPRKVEVLNKVDSIITTQKGRDLLPGQRQLLAALGGFETSFDATVTNLMAYAASGDPSFRLAYGPQLATNAALWQELSDKRALLTPQQRRDLDVIAERRAEIGELALQIIHVIAGERAYEDLYLYRTEAEPQAQEMLRLLAALTVRQQTSLQTDLGRARDHLDSARVPAILGGMLAIVLAVALAVVAQRHIVGPMRRLTAVAEQVAPGDRLRAGAESRDEIGRLAQMISTRLRREELQQLMASVSDALWSAEIKGDGLFAYRYYSPVVERIAGRPPEYFLESPQRWLDTVHPEDRPTLAARFERITSGATDREEAEYRIVQPNGAVRWVRDSVRATRLDDGRTILNGVVSDITERKKAESALRESEARFRGLTELSSDWYWRQDENLRFTFLSSESSEKAGRSAASSIGKTRWELETVQLLSCSWPEHQAVLDARQPFRDLEYCRLDEQGRVRYISVSGAPIFDERGTFKGYQGVGRDISDRKRIEEQLRSRQEMLVLAQKAARAVAVDWRIDAPDEEHASSAELEAMFGLEPGMYDGTFKGLKQLVHPDDWPSLREAVHRANETGEVTAEYRVVAPSGPARWLQIKGKMLFDAVGKPARLVGFLLDITDRRTAEDELRRLEQQLRQAQRLEAIGTLAGGIAHDFNNILGAILGYGEMALRATPRSSRLRRDVESIMAAGERGRALVDRILAFSRSGVGDRVAVNIEEVVREALEMVAARLPDNVVIETDLRAGRAAMLGDSTQVHQVLMNLATNAIQAMPGGGTLRASLHVLRLDAPYAVTTGSIDAGEYVVLTIADNGLGIAGEVMERIFDPFFTTKDIGVGTGLGLSLVHGIVSEVGGAVNVESTLGVGSVFTVYLPRKGDAVNDCESEAAAAPRGDGQRILVVDDEEPLVRLATQNLAEWGYVTTSFTSSAAALEAFRADPQRYDAVITDERMPGLSGSALIREIRAVRAAIPVLLLSGYLGTDLVNRARDAGADEMLKKPLAMRDLAISLARVLPSYGNHAVRAAADVPAAEKSKPAGSRASDLLDGLW